MPITPFHFGPGGLLTVATRGRVGFIAFCATNALIDVESLYNMLTHQPRIHTFLHTYMGSTLAAIAVILALMRWRRVLPLPALTLGALLGAWSHVFLDSIMHADITPLAPFSNANTLLGLVSLRALHLGCMAAGLIALAWWALRSGGTADRERA